MHALGGHDEGVVALAAPSVDRPGEAVPAVPVAGGERRREHVVEVELGGGAVPGGAVVEDHARPQREGVLLSAGVEVIDFPRDRQGREDGAAGAVLDQTVVHKVVREELVGAVRVGVQPPHAGEQPRLRAGRDGHGPLARQDAQRVERVVELLLARGVAREAPADHRRDALAREGELGRLVVQRRQDLGPSGLALGLVLDLQDVRDLLGQDLLGDRRRQAFEGGEVCLVGGGPGGCVRVRVVRGPPGLREGHVEVARHHRRVELILGQRAQVHRDSHLGEVGADVVLQHEQVGLGVEHDEVEGKLAAAGAVEQRRLLEVVVEARREVDATVGGVLGEQRVGLLRQAGELLVDDGGLVDPVDDHLAHRELVRGGLGRVEDHDAVLQGLGEVGLEGGLALRHELGDGRGLQHAVADDGVEGPVEERALDVRVAVVADEPDGVHHLAAAGVPVVGVAREDDLLDGPLAVVALGAEHGLIRLVAPPTGARDAEGACVWRARGRAQGVSATARGSAREPAGEARDGRGTGAPDALRTRSSDTRAHLRR